MNIQEIASATAQIKDLLTPLAEKIGQKISELELFQFIIWTLFIFVFGFVWGCYKTLKHYEKRITEGEFNESARNN
jgi:hypothetical protein